MQWALINSRYLWAWIASSIIQDQIDENLTTGSTKQRELNLSTIQNLPVPVPPLEEQERIVARVDELMELCDQLEDKLSMQEELADEYVTASAHALVS